jgi:CRISPR/Cas system-associated exonuclease Cas4 (RecB family)
LIRISESLIKDFLLCPKRADFRINYSGESIQTSKEATGSIVHAVLERSWRNSKEALEEIEIQIRKYNLKSDSKLIYKCIANYFSTFRNMVGEGDTVETFFNIPFSKGVQLVGRIDRITTNGIVIDWKTGESEPEDIERDIQCMFYYLAYKKLYGREPSGVYLAFLAKKKLIMYKPNPLLLNKLEYEIIPTVIRGIKNQEFPHNGLFQYHACKNCNFINSCWGNLGLE